MTFRLLLHKGLKLVNSAAIDPGRKAEQRLQALSVSRGRASGRLVFVPGRRSKHLRRSIDAALIEAEVRRFKLALQLALDDLAKLSTEHADTAGAAELGLLELQRMILETSIAEKVENAIRDEFVNAEWAVRNVGDEFIRRQSSVADVRFREKSQDIDDSIERLLGALRKSGPETEIEAGSVLYLADPRPGLLMELAGAHPSAIISEHGGWTSHVSILARELRLPMVTGLSDLDAAASSGDLVIVDGDVGELIINPTEESLRSIQGARLEAVVRETADPSGCILSDGVEITIRANADSAETFASAIAAGAKGIGLFRSETILSHLGMDPSEDEQYLAYRRLAEAAGPECLRLRLFDIGPDITADRRSRERNPALGLRAIRYGLNDPRSMRTQIRAVLRASCFGEIDIILPMVSNIDEIRRTRAIIADERTLLESTGTPVGSPRLGVMIETPAAVIVADALAHESDLFCVGTNDLVQYLLAVDRDNESVAEWYQSLHPAVIRSLRNVVSAAAGANIPVSVCGEMAGSPFYVPLLLGLGVRELSMNVNAITPVKHLLSGLTLDDCEALASISLQSDSARHAEEALRSVYLERFEKLFPSGLLNVRHS